MSSSSCQTGETSCILLPFTGAAISRRSLDAAFRVARGERHARPAPETRNGLSGDDLIWLLERVPAEVLILRPGFDDQRRLTGAAI